MRLANANFQEKGLGRISLFDEIYTLLHYVVTRSAICVGNRFGMGYEFPPGAHHPLIKSLVSGCRVLAVETAKMPFTDKARLVAFLFEYFRDSHFLVPQVNGPSA